MKKVSQVLSLAAVVIGTLLLFICMTAPSGHAARDLITSLPIIIAGGLIGLAISSKDEDRT